MNNAATVESAAEALERLLWVNDWRTFDYISADATITLKGVAVTSSTLRRMFGVNGLSSVCVLAEKIVSLRLESDQISACLRMAIIGLREPRARVDGVISDLEVTLLRSGRTWLATRLDFRCPPDSVLWEARPNAQAPVDYRIEAVTREGLRRLVRSTKWRFREHLQNETNAASDSSYTSVIRRNDERDSSVTQETAE